MLGTARALTPDQVAVLVAKDDPDSRQVADHYIAARHIPSNHIIEIPAAGNSIAENDFRTAVVPLIRQTLIDRHLDKQITCLVTTFGIPLRIDPVKPSDAQRQEITDYRHQLVDALEELKTATAAYQAILIPPADSQPGPPTTAPAGTTHALEPEIPPLPLLQQRLDKAVNEAIQRIRHAADADRQKALMDFMQLHERVTGLSGLSNLLKESVGNTDPAAQQKRDELARQVENGQMLYATLAASRDSPQSRRTMIDLRRRYHGLVGVVGELQLEIGYLQGEQSDAAFDSDLMMLWVNGYPRTRWLSNPMEVSHWPYLLHRETLPRVLLVARLDGLTPAKVNDMVDQSIKTETAGLDGVVYFDARGLHGMDDYSRYDADIRLAATYMRDNTDMKIVLDDNPALLKAADCPDAALYCGWYSVRNYQESCQWLPGSVAYHVASFEMVTLHDPAEKGWCSNLLRRGVCGTLGSVNEPFLFSFPQPSLFFPLLVSGLFTQGEVYFLTIPNTSWQVAFVGDPLYNPFKNKPRLTLDKLRAHPILRNALTELGIDPDSATPHN
jgi:uncharacterized protein (TIGR03790 family)